MVKCELCNELLGDPVECTSVGCGLPVCRTCWEFTAGDQIKNIEEESTSLITTDEASAKLCAQCGSSSGCRPSLSMLRILDKLKWQCRNRDLGCDEELI